MEQIVMLDVLRRRVWMIIAVGVVAALAGYAFSFVSFLIPERYTASALVLVRPQTPIRLDTTKADKEIMDYPIAQSNSVETPGKTYVEIIKSRQLIEHVVRKLGLGAGEKKESSGTDVEPAFLQAAEADLKQWFKDLVSVVKYGRVLPDNPLARAVKAVQDNLSTKSREDTYLFEVTFKGDDPKTAANVVNTAVQLFSDYMTDMRLTESQFVREHLKTELEQSRKELDKASQALKNYKEKHAIFLYESEYTSDLKVVSELAVELAKSEAALLGSKNTLSQMTLEARRQGLLRSMKAWEADRTRLPGIEHDLKELELNVQVALTAYKVIDKEFTEADLKHSYPMPEIVMVSHAVPPEAPSSPARITILLVALLGGLVAGVSLAVFLEYLNRRVRSVDDVEDFVGVKVLATIPRVSRSNWDRAGRQ